MAACLVRRQPFHWLLVQGIHLFVPRRRVGVIVVLFDEAGRILLLQHVFHPFYPWGLPGGWLGRGEAPAAGALRELREETGLTAVLGPIIHVSHNEQPDHLAIAYRAQVQPGPLTLSAEIIEAKWCTVARLPDRLLPLHRQAIETAVRQTI